MMLRFAVLLLTFGLAPSVPVHAQLFSYERESPRPTQSITAVMAPIDFNYRGDGDPTERFDFAAVAWGVQYTRPSLHVSVLFGTHVPEGRPDDDKLSLIDASLFTWGEIGLSRRLSGGINRLFLPIVLHSSFRRVSLASEAETAVDAFSVTVIGLGTGLGFNGQIGSAQVEIRATPIIGLATRSFGDASGSATIFDGDAMLHLGPVVGRVGLSFGYAFRSQRWNVGASDLLQDVSDDFFDYAGAQHLIRAGFSF